MTGFVSCNDESPPRLFCVEILTVLGERGVDAVLELIGILGLVRAPTVRMTLDQPRRSLLLSCGTFASMAVVRSPSNDFRRGSPNK